LWQSLLTGCLSNERLGKGEIAFCFDKKTRTVSKIVVRETGNKKADPVARLFLSFGTFFDIQARQRLLRGLSRDWEILSVF